MGNSNKHHSLSRSIMGKACIVFCAAFILLLLSGSSYPVSAGHTYINIKDPFIRKIPVAVPDFKLFTTADHERNHALNARQILADALDFTGYMNIMDREAFLENPAETGISRAEINFKNWTSIGTELLVTGGISSVKDGVRLQLRLFDTFKERLLVGKVYTGHKADIRKMVHRFCGEISYNLTGKWGVFNSQIVFVSKVDGNKEIFICEFDGTSPRQITRLKSISLSPSWSSDSQWIAYTSYVKGNPDIYIKNIKQNRGTVVGLKGLNITPDWVPGQFSLAAALSFSGDQEIYLLTGKGKIIKRITRSWGIDVSPEFSPDGKQIAFVSRRSGSPQIFIQTIATGEVRRLTFEGKYNTSPSWSPDGDKIAYVCVENGGIDIHVIGIGGNGRVQLTQDSGDNESPSWSPDGSLIVFASNRVGVSRIYAMTSAGGEQRCLLKLKGSQSDPEWSLGNSEN